MIYQPNVLKRCTKCGELKLPNEFHRNRITPDGYHRNCKTCRANQEGFNYKPPRPYVVPGYRYCDACKSIYPATHEHFQLGTKSSKHYCKRCIQDRKRQWADQNRVHVRNYFQSYWKARRRKRQEITRAYRARNLNKVRAAGRKCYHAHKDAYREARRIRRRAQPNTRAAEKQRRRARQQNMPAKFTKTDWQRALNYFDGCCAVCGRPRGLWHTLAADHWIPLSAPDCPGTIPTNIVPLCHGLDGCNNSKGGNDPVEWLVRQFNKRKTRQILARIEAYFDWVKQQGAHES